MSTTWNTKYGSRRVRHDPPTLAEAFAAAQGLSEDRDEQAEIAAGLMGVPVAEARAAIVELAPDRRAAVTMTTTGRDKSVRTVIIERKASRRIVPRDALARASATGRS